MLESHHWRFAISCIRESGLFDHFSEEQWKQVRCDTRATVPHVMPLWKQVRHLLKSLILATDITQQPKVSALRPEALMNEMFAVPVSRTAEEMPLIACISGCEFEDVGS